jgi:hypothetical protein
LPLDEAMILKFRFYHPSGNYKIHSGIENGVLYIYIYICGLFNAVINRSDYIAGVAATRLAHVAGAARAKYLCSVLRTKYFEYHNSG